MSYWLKATTASVSVHWTPFLLRVKSRISNETGIDCSKSCMKGQERSANSSKTTSTCPIGFRTQGKIRRNKSINKQWLRIDSNMKESRYARQNEKIYHQCTMAILRERDLSLRWGSEAQGEITDTVHLILLIILIYFLILVFKFILRKNFLNL